MTMAMERNALGLTTLMVVVLFGAALVGIMLRAGEPSDPSWWMLLIPFLGWCLAPIVVPLSAARRSWFMTIGMALLCAVSLYIYLRDMFGPGARSTSALIFLFLPIYQWVAVAVLIGLAWALRQFVR